MFLPLRGPISRFNAHKQTPSHTHAQQEYFMLSGDQEFENLVTVHTLIMKSALVSKVGGFLKCIKCHNILGR